MTRRSLFRRPTSFLSPAPAGDRPRARPAATPLSVERLEARDVPAFVASALYPNNSTYTGTVVAADFNGDGLSDVAVHNPFSEHAGYVRLNNGDGTLGPLKPFQTDVHWGYEQTLTAGDFNGDGHVDLASANVYDVSILLGNGDGTFATQAPLSGWDYATTSAVTTGDLNGDGKLDLVVGTSEYAPYPSLYAYLGNGDGSFAAPEKYELPEGDGYDEITQIQVGDLNADGHPDVVVARTYHTLNVLLGGGGTLGPAASYATGAGPTVWTRSVAIGDVNADGHPDLVAADNGGMGVRVLPGNGTGAFPTYQTYTVGESPTSVKLADVNGDGRLDVLTANTSGDNVSVLLSVSGGTFALARNFASNGDPYSLAVGNFNGDSYPDLVVSNSLPRGVSTMLNDGNWTLIGTPTLSIGDVSKAEGNKGTIYFSFTVTLAFSLDVPATVNYATANGTATTANSDYVAKSGTITFAPGETSKTISIEVKGDRKKEANETFFVRLSVAVNALIADNEGVGTILNDD